MEREKLIINKVRAFYYMAGVLKLQGTDPRCAVCKTRKEVAEELKIDFERFKNEISLQEIPELFRSKFEAVEEILQNLVLPEKPISQRKEGGCHFPDKECLVKESYDIFEDLCEEEDD